jgi:hypothetical protein
VNGTLLGHIQTTCLKFNVKKRGIDVAAQL